MNGQFGARKYSNLWQKTLMAAGNTKTRAEGNDRFYTNDTTSSDYLKIYIRGFGKSAVVRYGYSFIVEKYKVTAAEGVNVTSELSSGNGSVSQGEKYISKDTDVTFTVADGYEPQVTVDGVEASVTANVDGVYSVKATGPVVIGTVANPAAYKLTINDEVYYADYNAQVTLTENAGTFSYWKKNNEIVSFDNTYTFYAWENAIIEAVYNDDATPKASCAYITYRVEEDNLAIYVETTFKEGISKKGRVLASPTIKLNDSTKSTVTLSGLNNGKFWDAQELSTGTYQYKLSLGPVSGFDTNPVTSEDATATLNAYSKMIVKVECKDTANSSNAFTDNGCVFNFIGTDSNTGVDLSGGIDATTRGRAADTF